jgi:hypothetical protein
MYVNVKVIPETAPGIKRGQMEESKRGVDFTYDIFDTLQEPL